MNMLLRLAHGPRRLVFWLCTALLLAAVLTPEVAFAQEQQVVPLDQRITDYSAADWCWGCTMFAKMASVTHQMGNGVSNNFNAGLQSLLAALMGVWVSWQFVRLASNVSGTVDPGQIVQSITSKLFVFVFVIAMLSGNTYELVATNFIYPFFEAAAGIANSVLAVGGVSGGSCSNPSGPDEIQGMITSGNKMMCALHLATGKGMGYGRYLIDLGAGGVWFQGFDLGKIVGGLFVMITFFYLSVLLPFRLFDSLIRLAVVAVITPILVVAATFKVSRGAARQGLLSVVVACLNFVFVAIAVAISLTILDQIIAGTVIAKQKDATQAGGFGPLNVGEFLLLIGTAFGMSAFVRTAGSLAAEFGGFQGQQGDVGGAAAGVPQLALNTAVAAPSAVAGFAATRGVSALAARAGKASKSAPVNAGGLQP